MTRVSVMAPSILAFENRGYILKPAAMVTISDLVRRSPPIVIKRAIVRAGGHAPSCSRDISARRRRVAHSDTTHRLPR